MTQGLNPPPVLLRNRDFAWPMHIAESAFTDEGALVGLTGFHRWFADLAQRDSFVDRISFGELTKWGFEPESGNLRHDSGKFFLVEGLHVQTAHGPVVEWSQPIINQPEIGILGILVKDFDGVLHCLMQAKMEPGNCNGVQLSPTVQATRSNYTRVHRGRSVPYLDFIQRAEPHRILVDVLQSEQGSWFYRKRNRNMVVEVVEDVDVVDGFVWLTIGQLHRLLAVDNLVNMDSRTVLSCLPFAGDGLAATFPFTSDPFRSALMRSMSEDQGSMYSSTQILSWITAVRTHNEVRTTRIGLTEASGWRRFDDRISHDHEAFFDVIAVSVRASDREANRWTQPMIEPHGTGVVAFLVKQIGGVLHVLVNARVEPGYLNVAELAPTVQCTPGNYAHLPVSARPLFLDRVLAAPQDRIRFDTVHSEEGGRFFNARNRYLIVETGADEDLDVPADFRWMTLHQLTGLLQHSHYVNVQARSLTACLHSLCGEPGRP